MCCGNPPQYARQLHDCLADGDAIIAKGYLDEDDLERFYSYNLAFHDLLVGSSENHAIAYVLSRNNHLPFASAAALAVDRDDLPATYDHLAAAHREHVAVSDAILKGQADDAERLMRLMRGRRWPTARTRWLRCSEAMVSPRYRNTRQLTPGLIWRKRAIYPAPAKPVPC